MVKFKRYLNINKKQAIDLIAGGRSKNSKTKQLRSPNTYHRLAVKLYKFLARRTSSKVNALILKRMMNSRVHRCPVSVARLAKFAARKSYSTVNKA